MNRKIQMTKKLIRLALFECLKEKDINKITISSLCEKADINRSTFYKYYGSQYDVIKEMEQEVIQLINEQLNDQPKETSFIQLLQFLKSNKETIKIFFECNVDNEFPKQVLALDSINNQLEQVSQNDPYIKNYILFGSLATIQQWIDAGCIESCEALNKQGFLAVLPLLPCPVTLKKAMDKKFTCQNIERTIHQLMRLINYFSVDNIKE